MSGAERQGVLVSLLVHGVFVMVAVVLSASARTAERVTIDFSLIASRVIPQGGDGEDQPDKADAVAPPPVVSPRPERQEPPPEPIEPPPREVAEMPLEPEVLPPELAEMAVPVPLEEPAKVEDVPVESPPSDDPLHESSRVDEHAAFAESSANTAVTTSDPQGMPHAGIGADGFPPDVPTSVPGRDYSFIRDKVQRNVVYPSVARRMGWEGRVRLSFTVCPDGRVEDVEVVESSGIPLLDKCAIEAVKKTSPFPPQQLEARVIIPIAYELVN